MKTNRIYNLLEMICVVIFILSCGVLVKTSKILNPKPKTDQEVLKAYHLKRKIKIAIVDTGVDFSHQILTAYKTKNQEPEKMYNPHGTQVAGVIALNLYNVFGEDAKHLFEIESFQYFLDEYGKSNYSYYSALDRATISKPDIMNISTSGEDYFLEEDVFLTHAKQEGIKIIVAAGNEGDIANHYPCSLKVVVCVGYLDGNKINRQSNFGHDVKFYAQGTNIILPSFDKKYDIGSGSSYAAPVVAAYEASLMVSPKIEKLQEIRNKIKEVSPNRNLAQK